MSFLGYGRVEFIPALTQQAKALVVVSHGLGDTYAGWVWLPRVMRQLNSRFNDVAFVFPTARMIPVTWAKGSIQTAWYDIVSLDHRAITSGDSKPPTGLDDSRSYIHSILTDYASELKLPAHRTVLGGFSQGGALALAAGLSYPRRLGGIFCLSGYLPVRPALAVETNKSAGDANRETPVLMIHGDDDQVVSVDYGRLTREALKKEGYDVELEVYDGVQHSIDERGLESLAKYLIRQIDEMDTLDKEAAAAAAAAEGDGSAGAVGGQGKLKNEL